MAAPHPVGVDVGEPPGLLQEAQERGRLRVVHHDEVVIALDQQRVVEHPFEIDALHLVGPFDVAALQRVVHRLGDGEELVAPAHHLPFGVDAGVAEERHVRRQQLRDPAAVGSGADMEHPGALQRVGPGPDPLDGTGPATSA